MNLRNTLCSCAVIAGLSFSALAAAAPDQPALPSDTALISGTTAKVTKGDFDQEFKNVPVEVRLDFLTNRGRIERMLERLFLNKAAVSRARKEGFDKNPEVIAEIHHAMENKLAALYLEHLKTTITVPDLEARARESFKLSADKLALPERVRASHVLISTKKYSKEEAVKRANEVYAKARAGENFESLVSAYSDDPSASTNKGDLGYFTKERMVPEFSQAAFALQKAGDISAPVESQFGLHVIRLTGRQASKPAVYEEHRPGLLEQAESAYRDAQMKLLIDKLLEAEKPRANQKAVDTLQKKADIGALIKQQEAAQPQPKQK